MSREELAQLSKEELIDLILKQAELLAQLQTALQQLQADYDALKWKFEKNRKPPISSKNSSQPPSKDQKSSLSRNRHKRKHGPPEGHEKNARQFVTQPGHVLELKAETCRTCHADLSKETGQLKRLNQITEVPPAPAEVIEVRQYEVKCPHCGRVEVEEPPAGLEMERAFGTRLEATVVYYRQEQHMSYERTQKALFDLHRVEISQGGIDEIMKRAGHSAIQKTEAIHESIQQSKVIHCDETSSRVDGANWWEWVFCTLIGVLHIIRDTRSEDVIQDVMGQARADVWVSDCYGAQLRAPTAQRQLCLAHQLRNLQAVVDQYPRLFWPRAMQILFRYAIRLHRQRSQYAPDQFALQITRVERLCDILLERSLSPPEAGKLQRRYKKHRQSLFVFLCRTDVEPTNNVAERALRPSVIHRKVTGGFRSEWGAKAYAALASVIDTAELAGVGSFEAIQSLFGTPALPIPFAGE